MNIISVWITIGSSLISGIIAAIVSNLYQKRRAEIDRKTKFVQDFFGYRFELSNSNSKIDKEKINYLLGQVPIVFGENEHVMKYYGKICRGNSNNKIIENLLKAMIEDKYVNYKKKKLSEDSFLKMPFVE